MAKTLAVNANNDLYLDDQGNIAVSYDLQALLETCSQAAKTRLGEMVLNTDQGIPYFETVFIGVPQLKQFEAALRATFLAIDGVVEVVSLITAQQDNTLTYTAIIRTIYGTGGVNG